MNIAYLGNLSAIHLVRWVNAMADRGYQVSVLSSHEPVAPLLESVAHFRLPAPAPLGYAANAPAVRRFLRQLNPELLHSHYATGYGTLATLTGFHPRVVSVWGSDVFLFPRKSFLHKRLLQWVLSRADLITSTSFAMANEVDRLVGIQPQVIHFGVDVAQFSPMSKSQGNRLLIGSARRFLPRYGLDVLIKAFELLLSEARSGTEPISLELMLVGDGPQKPELQRLAKALGVEAHISFPGYVPHQDLPSVIQQMDIFVVPSRSESFGVAALEASACGLPVVASHVGGLPEVVQDEVTGLLFPSEDAQALAGALARLAASPDLRHRMGQAGRQLVVQQYFWGQSVDQMDSLYCRFLSSRK